MIFFKNIWEILIWVEYIYFIIIIIIILNSI